MYGEPHVLTGSVMLMQASKMFLAQCLLLQDADITVTVDIRLTNMEIVIGDIK